MIFADFEIFPIIIFENIFNTFLTIWKHIFNWYVKYRFPDKEKGVYCKRRYSQNFTKKIYENTAAKSNNNIYHVKDNIQKITFSTNYEISTSKIMQQMM